MATTEASSQRSMPHDADAEAAVLCSILINPNEALDYSLELLTVEHFYQRRHQTIFSALLNMHNQGDPISPPTLVTRLKDAGKLEEVGGPHYLSQLTSTLPTAAHFKFFITTLREKYHLRQLIEVASSVLEEAFDPRDKVENLMDRVETDVLKICDDDLRRDEVSIKEITERIIIKAGEIHENRGKLDGISWGFRDLNKFTFGLRPAEMVVIAARPGIGKTSLALNVAEKLVLEEKIPVGIFSLEMTAEQLALRMACSKARMNYWDLHQGGVNDAKLQEFSRAAGMIGNSQLHIIDTSRMNIVQLRASARRLKSREHIQILIIDYLQLMTGTDLNRNDSREREVAAISNGIKALAKDLSIPVLVLSQLNRQSEQEGTAPKLANLRESGAIEQDADIVCLLDHRDLPYEKESGKPLEAITAGVNIAKNRNGPVGEIKLTFFPKYTRFEDFSAADPL